MQPVSARHTYSTNIVHKYSEPFHCQLEPIDAVMAYNQRKRELLDSTTDLTVLFPKREETTADYHSRLDPNSVFPPKAWDTWSLKPSETLPQWRKRQRDAIHQKESRDRRLHLHKT